MPRWAWYVAGYFGVRAALISSEGIPLDAAISLSLHNPTRSITDIVAAEKVRLQTNLALFAAGVPQIPQASEW